MARRLSPWDYAVSLYARPGVEPVCLSLQDDHGQCVPLLLWRLWALDRPVDGAVLSSAIKAALLWDTVVVIPLRTIRRNLPVPIFGAADKVRAALRESLKADELGAERRLLDELVALTPAAAGPPANALEALSDLVDAWGAPAPRALLARLAGAAASVTSWAAPDAEGAMDDIDGDDEVTIRLALADLRLAHQDLDAAVRALESGPQPDQLRIARLKKRKLGLRDQIAKLDDRLTPDIIA